jgi:superfamily I DNA/RNA helicase
MMVSLAPRGTCGAFLFWSTVWALLIIAGAGSGKTNTLAHRVAYLVTNGIDPRRIMLLTFSRRAATEMGRRVERIAANVIGSRASTVIHSLTWSGTFHALGARLLREYAPRIGLDRSFTIHDRGGNARGAKGAGHRHWARVNRQREEPDEQWKAAAFGRWHEPDDARVSSPDL